MPVMGSGLNINQKIQDYHFDPISDAISTAINPYLDPPILKKTPSPIEKQEGGGHYKEFPIQPMTYIMKNKLDWCEGNVVKLVTRWKLKGGVGDLRKAIHYLEVLIDEVEKDEVSSS